MLLLPETVYALRLEFLYDSHCGELEPLWQQIYCIYPYVCMFVCLFLTIIFVEIRI